MSGSSRKFRRAQWRNAQPGEPLPPEWGKVEERERAAYREVLDIVKAKMPGRAFILLTCPPGKSGEEQSVPVEAIGYGSNLADRLQAVEIFHALEDYWHQHGVARAVLRASKPKPPASPPADGSFKRRIRELWADFEAGVLPEDASDVQRQETRRAFYAGAFALQDALGAAVSAGEAMTAEDERMLTDLLAEREEYLVNLSLGRA